MTKKMSRVFVGAFVVVGLFVSFVCAVQDYGQILADQGSLAVGKAVEQDVTASGLNQPELVAIFNELETTGSTNAMLYGIVGAARMAGVDDLDKVRSAVNNSAIFANYPEFVAFALVEAEKALNDAGGAGGNEGDQGGGGGEEGGDDPEMGGDDQELGGDDPQSLGGGDPELFDPDGAVHFGTIDDRDSAATPH